MNPGPRKDAPKVTPEAGPSEPLDNDLLTSQDLFGDLVDAPPAQVAPPAAAARRGPIKVQVFDAASDALVVRSARAPIDAQAADALLDVLGGGPEPSDPASPPDLAGVLSLQAPPLDMPAAPLADAAESDGLLDGLVADEPGRSEQPPPSATFSARAAQRSNESSTPLTGHGLEFESLLDNLGPEPEAAPAPPPPALPGATARPRAATAPAAPARKAPSDPLDALLRAAAPTRPREKAAEGEATDAARPAARTATRFKAASARPAADQGALLDLALVAETALGDRSRTSPVIQVEAGKPRKRRPPERGAYGPYLLLERLAVGGMAEVFRAKRTGVEGFEKILAVKRILPHLSDNQEFVDMFIHEAKMVAGLTHPNIVQIFDLGRLESSYYIAMEYVHGRDLRSIQKRAEERGVRIPLDLAALIVSKVCSALEYAHRKKDDRGRPLSIVHRDVSPQNILISFEGDVRLTDFGIAKAASKATITDRGALRGKLLYMSPEQAWGRTIDRRADIFSLGVVFYELATGHKPFLASSEGSILDAVRECRVAPPTTINPRIPEKLARVVMKALDRDPEQRYQDAAEMYRDLDRVLHERQVPSAPELSRLMHVLYDEKERGELVPEDDAMAAGDELHVEFEASPEGSAEQLERGRRRRDGLGPEFDGPGEPKTGNTSGPDPSIEKLLKRIGIQ